jgi:DNA-binding response OmpR family regulator
VLVMVSANHSEIDRVRGSLAGSDAFLGKPLDDDALRPLLAQHGVHYPESAALGASMA